APNWRQRILVRRWHSFLRMQKKVVQQLGHIVTVSEQSRRDISQAFDRPEKDIGLVHCGIDTDTFRPLEHIKEDPWQLITTASADQPLKGLRFLLEALHQLQQPFPKLKLLVVGKLKQDGATAKQLKRLKLCDKVSFVSGISTEELVEHYNRSAIAISPSLYEGFGLPAGEAMSCQRPVISSDGGALPEIVGDAGLVVKAGDSQALASAISELLSDPERRQQIAAACRARIEQTFSWENAAAEFSDYYYQMLETQACKP
ncbi:MAG: glycosyltransferase family 4 protein, partial [Cellvibrionaceae bacterium]|nr:glycosyltransferase family 4 protein [Cellvibrionaceae bacterium]